MVPNKEEIQKRIKGLTSVCEKGKEEVTLLVEAITGLSLQPPVKIQAGMVIAFSNAPKTPCYVVVKSYEGRLSLMEWCSSHVYSDSVESIQNTIDSGYRFIYARTIEEACEKLKNDE